MALFELVTTIFLISTLLSLMGKKRAAPEEVEPSRPSYSRKKMSAEIRASVKRRSKRDLDPRIPLKRFLSAGVELGKFRDRKVVFEAHVDEKLFGLYPVIDLLLEIGWGPIFEGKAHASEGTVRAFYAHIRNPILEPFQFPIPLGKQEAIVDMDVMARIMGIERGVVHGNETHLASGREKDRRTRFLCGRLVHWRRESGLTSKRMKAEFRLLHHICTLNIYPRWSNRTEYTRFMVDSYTELDKGKNVCSPCNDS